MFLHEGVPRHFRGDIDPEFTARATPRWLEQVVVKALYAEPWTPRENGYAESFNSRLRDESLASEEFENRARPAS